MNKNQRRNIMKNYILGRETESFVADSIEEINRLSLLRDANAEIEENIAPDVPADSNN